MEGEDQPRQLQCHLLAPGEGEDISPMTPDEILSLFTSSPVPEPGIDATEGDEESENEVPEEDDPVNIEASNIVPPIANDPGDGLLGFGDDGALVQVDEVMGPAHPFGFVEEAHDDFDAEDLVVDGEFLWEPAPKHQHLPDDIPVFSGLPSSASSAGCNQTPAEVRQMVPPAPGVKIQHRSSKSGKASSGYQVWYASDMGSKWYSYGKPSGRYATQEAALQVALEWLWEMDKKHNSKVK